jgi:protein-S-isoprenylcysteine O-methyltransferase Ste14
MPQAIVAVGIGACWGTVVLVWIGGALYNRRRAPRVGIRDRSGLPAYLAATAICAAVVLGGYDFFHSLVFDTIWTGVIGLVVLVASAALSVWARLSLGTMWSVGPEVGGDRRLRTGGPYALTRHPIYSGLLGMLIGTTLLAGGHELIALVVVGVVLFEVKIRQEERLMLATFPDEYPAYRRRVPQIVPGLGLLRVRR